MIVSLETAPPRPWAVFRIALTVPPLLRGRAFSFEAMSFLRRCSVQGTDQPDREYRGSMVRMNTVIERTQTGVRIEKRILKVLKALAEYHDMSLGDLLEGIVLHAFEGKAPFGAESLKRISDLKKIYGLDLTAANSHKLIESTRARSTKRK
jgi:hypothetical protein